MRGKKIKSKNKLSRRLIYSAVEESFIDGLYRSQHVFFWFACFTMLANSSTFYDKGQIGLLAIQVLFLVYFFWAHIHYARVWRKGLDYPVAKRNLRITITISQVAFFASFYLLLYSIGKIGELAAFLSRLGIATTLSKWLSHILTVAVEGVIGNTAFAVVKRYTWDKAVRQNGATTARGRSAPY